MTKLFDTELLLPIPKNWRYLKHHSFTHHLPYDAGKDMEALIESMKEHGYDAGKPIIVCRDGNEDTILIGRRRHEAAVKAGIDPSMRRYIGSDPFGYLFHDVAFQKPRTPSEISRLAFIYIEASVSRYGEKPSIARIKEIFGFGSRTAAKASAVFAKAPEEVKEKVRAGEQSVSAAYAEINPPAITEDADEQDEPGDVPPNEEERQPVSEETEEPQPQRTRSTNGKPAKKLRSQEFHERMGGLVRWLNAIAEQEEAQWNQHYLQIREMLDQAAAEWEALVSEM